ncbi:MULTISPECIES: hypothetical protein [unclassified Paraburkholderia]|uniref:hypothetical protein n=1 Tax=unclassified Paraburkholderia TaxID=2615204 RepID=UPI00286F6E98|nr:MULTISPECIES: hypothetical protein [unclassified Paraburkholderia]
MRDFPASACFDSRRAVRFRRSAQYGIESCDEAKRQRNAEDARQKRNAFAAIPSRALSLRFINRHADGIEARSSRVNPESRIGQRVQNHNRRRRDPWPQSWRSDPGRVTARSGKPA